MGLGGEILKFSVGLLDRDARGGGGGGQGGVAKQRNPRRSQLPWQPKHVTAMPPTPPLPPAANAVAISRRSGNLPHPPVIRFLEGRLG